MTEMRNGSHDGRGTVGSAHRFRVRAPGALVLAPLAVLLAQGCGEARAAPDALDLWERVELETPTAEGAGEPNLFAADDGHIYLSWIEPTGPDRHAVRFATLDPRGGERGSAPRWSAPRTIAEGADFFVNWADFPSLRVDEEGRIVAHWLVRSGPGRVDYDVHVAWSLDGGETWTEPQIPHRDGTLSEHGFVSMIPWHDGSMGVVWLDGRHYAGWDEEAGRVVEPGRPDDPEMSLRFTTLTPHALGEEVVLDDRVCDCCQTSAALTDRGPVVVYRDRGPGEIRDISIVRFEDGRWTDPVPVHRDGWEIPACPVNGPMVAARGSFVAVAWFTRANDKPLVRLAFSEDGGASFAPPVRIDDGNPVGRVAVTLGEGGRAHVAWLERVGDGAEVRVRWVDREGERGRAATVTRTAESRASGFPRMVRADDGLLFAWTDVDGSGRVEVAMIRPGGS
jgi:hypothetical protein